MLLFSFIAGARAYPEIPADIQDPPYEPPPAPIIYSYEKIEEDGRDIKPEVLYLDENYKRAAYHGYWHPDYSRWSYAPDLVHFALHKIYTVYPSASMYYDFIHQTGIAEIAGKIKNNGENPLSHILFVVFGGKIVKTKTLGNQIALTVKQTPDGAGVYIIPLSVIKPDDAKKALFFGLYTPDGDLYDYALETYAQSLN